MWNLWLGLGVKQSPAEVRLRYLGSLELECSASRQQQSSDGDGGGHERGDRPPGRVVPVTSASASVEGKKRWPTHARRGVARRNRRGSSGAGSGQRAQR